MVKFGRFLTILGISALCSLVAAETDNYTGECKEFNDFLSEYNASVTYCDMESEKILEVYLTAETLSQPIIDKLGTYSTDIISFRNIGKIQKNLNLNPVSAIIMSFGNFSKKGLTIPKNVLKTANNVERLFISGYKITQSNINDIGALNSVDRLGLNDCSYEKYIDFSKLNNNEVLTALQFFSSEEPSIDKIPESVCKITNLRELIFNNGNITSVPKCIGKLQNLRTLAIESNKLSNLPEELGKLTSLELLRLNNNRFTSIPSVIGKLTSLTGIDMSFNNITKIPSSITKLPNLDFINLNNNEIKLIPDSIANLKKLSGIHLENNQIKLIPDSIGKLKNLRGIYLNNNEITNLPNALGKLKNLSTIQLNNNKINARIPESLNKLKKLYDFEVDGNIDIRGKTLTNPELMDCYYNEESNKTKNGLCLAKRTVCKPRYKLPKCK